jgi:hypothetical protein
MSVLRRDRFAILATETSVFVHEQAIDPWSGEFRAERVVRNRREQDLHRPTLTTDVREACRRYALLKRPIDRPCASGIYGMAEEGSLLQS